MTHIAYRDVGGMKGRNTKNVRGELVEEKPRR